MPCNDNDSFYNYCKTLTDPQLANVINREYEAGRQDDYAAAKVVAAERGWRIAKGQRVG